MTDIWAMGVTLYIFIFGKVPFMSESVHAIYKAIMEQSYASLRSLCSVLLCSVVVV
jgi:serine/threonine protein kinase